MVYELRPEILKASKKAAEYEYDVNQYAVIDTGVRRCSGCGRLTKIMQNEEKMTDKPPLQIIEEALLSARDEADCIENYNMSVIDALDEALKAVEEIRAGVPDGLEEQSIEYFAHACFEGEFEHYFEFVVWKAAKHLLKITGGNDESKGS